MKKSLLIVFNNCQWPSVPDKVEALRSWFTPQVELEISVSHSSFSYIPFERYGEEGQDGVSKIWYRTFVAPLAKGHDMVLFVVNKDQWAGKKARGWRGGVKNGAVALQLGADEFEPFWKRLLGLDGEMFHQVARHEILHGLFFLKCGPYVQWDGEPEEGKCVDTTHYHWDRGQLKKALDDLVPGQTKREPAIHKELVIIHHTATPRDKTNLDAILRDHNLRYGRSFYQCFVTADGKVHWQHQIKNQRTNAVSTDYCVVGDFTREKPTLEQLEALDKLTEGKWVVGHGQATQYGATASACPGTLLTDLANLREQKRLMKKQISLLGQLLELLRLK